MNDGSFPVCIKKKTRKGIEVPRVFFVCFGCCSDVDDGAPRCVLNVGEMMTHTDSISLSAMLNSLAQYQRRESVKSVSGL